MSNYRKHIDNFFREKLGKYRETPPPDVWDALESRLDGLAPATTGHSYRWAIHTAIISAIVMLSGYVGWQKYHNNNTPAGPAAPEATLAQTTSSANPASTANANVSAADVTAPQQNNTSSGITSNSTSPTLSAAGPSSLSGPARNTLASDNARNTTHGNRTVPASAAHRAIAKNNTSSSNKNSNNLKHLNSSIAFNSNPTDHKNSVNPSPGETDQLIEAASPNTTLSVVSKPEVPAGTEQNKPSQAPVAAAKSNSSKKQQPIFPRLEAGVKVGYEGGFSANDAQKAVVAPYVQYNISARVSIMTQPAIKVASVRERQIGNTGTYYYANREDGKQTLEKVIDKTTGSGTEIRPEYWSVYSYTQKHDSIVKTNRIGGTSMQFEVPLLLQYKICAKTSVYGGVNITYSKLTTIKEHTYTQKNIVRTYNDTVISTSLPANSPDMGFTYAGDDIADYKGALTPARSGSEVNVGYMVGVTYKLSKKLMVDALVQQAPAKADYKGGYNINAPLSAPYFRLSVGYKITK